PVAVPRRRVVACVAMRDLWAERDLPVLVALGQAESDGVRATDTSLAERLGWERTTVAESLRALEEDGYVTGNAAVAHGGQVVRYGGPRTAPKGRRTVGSWPSEDPLAGLVTVLAQMIAEAVDSTQRTRLERLRDTARELGSGTVASLLATLLT